MPERAPYVSVIVPVYNDAARLRLCLRALEDQSYPTDRYEVVVVDNGSDPPVARASKAFPHARHDFEPIAGSFAARNRGISIARGALLGFTDSDCVPSSDWIMAGVKALQQGADMVGGEISVMPLDPDRLTPVDVHEIICGFPQDRYLREQRWAATANLFVRREVIDRVGAFDARLKSGGDKEWGPKVHAAGYRQIYACGVRVVHPSRRTFAAIIRRGIRTMGGHFQRQRHRSGFSWGLARTAMSSFASPIRQWLRYRSHGLLKPLRNRFYFLVVEWVLVGVVVYSVISLSLGKQPARA